MDDPTLGFVSSTLVKLAGRVTRMPSSRTSNGSRPIVNALLILGAVGWGLSRLVAGGRLDWPPRGLLASLSTLAGCLALVGPLILLGSGELAGNLGELVWMTIGILIWMCDLEAVLRGDWRGLRWATPISDRTIGLIVVAVLIAGWKCGLKEWRWSWTNLTGWALGVLWIGMAAGSWWLSPAGRASLAVR